MHTYFLLPLFIFYSSSTFRSIKPLFLAIRNPEAGEVVRQMRTDLSKDIIEFINHHAPELNLEEHSDTESSSNDHGNPNG